ncbi:uncharacterized protein [Rutidosis leptorrhynchoides]|uniref:uncharacterized protein n=1 Tax=Rutidosis leptorrhynchoides TaxID=125765 RepID=UPI003A98FCC7
MTGLLNNGDNNNKQIGCMSGFLQIFDRQHFLAGKRLHSTKRLPPPTTTETVSSGASQDDFQSSPSENADGKLKSLKSGKEMGRHSLDSRAIVDSKGSIRRKDAQSSNKSSECGSSNSNSNSNDSSNSTTSIADGDERQTRSPSVIARLMGLESLSSPHQEVSQNVVKPELRRSASETRVSKDVVHSKYIDTNNFQVKLPNQSQKQTNENVESVNTLKSECSRTNGWKSRSFFDSNDFYPERNRAISMDEQSNDLTTLKQILEVLQLKGLLHSSDTPLKRNNQRNFMYERNLRCDQSSIVLIKPGHDSSRATRKTVSENRKRNPGRNGNLSPNRIESNLKSCNSIVKRKPLSIEIQRRAKQPIDSLQNSPINSPNISPKRTNRLPKKKLVKNIVRDESNSIENELCTPSTTHSERYKWEGCKEGKSLLQRCDKLLHSIAEMTESQPSSGTIIPSPVSVLDSDGFDKDVSTSPLDSIDIIKAAPNVDFDECSSPQMLSTKHEELFSDDSDFIYISEILKVSQNHQQDSNLFYTVEKDLYNTKNTSNVSKQHRKLVFDVLFEILDRDNELPPWKASRGSSIKHIWFEFKKIRDINNVGDGLLDLISIVLKKDLVASVNGWGDHPIETSDAILEIELMIFKELVSDAIIDFDEFSSKRTFLRTQRRLVF